MTEDNSAEEKDQAAGMTEPSPDKQGEEHQPTVTQSGKLLCSFSLASLIGVVVNTNSPTH